MVSIGYASACDEFRPHELVDRARQAEQAGLERRWISESHRPFVRSVIGAHSQPTSLPVTTAAACSPIRAHPAVIAQATATAAVQCHGGFTPDPDTAGARRPPRDRQSVVSESVDLIRALHDGEEVLVSISMSALNPEGARPAGTKARGLCTVVPGIDTGHDENVPRNVPLD
ncbi:hypothetical protein BAY59_22925 [Prauserella coralliicola]|nr:hypothetical protein BAY59_22925 [Prauserella coralliicola]